MKSWLAMAINKFLKDRKYAGEGTTKGTLKKSSYAAVTNGKQHPSVVILRLIFSLSLSKVHMT